MSITIECPAPTNEVLIQRTLRWSPYLATYLAGYRFINGTTGISATVNLVSMYCTAEAARAAIDSEVDRYWTRWGWIVVRIDDDIT